MRHLISAFAVLAGLSTPVLADSDATMRELVGLSFPITVQPDGNTETHARQAFTLQFAPDGRVLVLSSDGSQVPGLPSSTFGVQNVDTSEGYSLVYQISMVLNLIYIKDVPDPAGTVPTPMPYDTIVICRLETPNGGGELNEVDCDFLSLPDGGSVSVSDF